MCPQTLKRARTMLLLLAAAATPWILQTAGCTGAQLAIWHTHKQRTADTAAAFGGYGESDGELIGPGDVALGPDGLLFVAESRFGRSRFGVCPPMVCALSSP